MVFACITGKLPFDVEMTEFNTVSYLKRSCPPPVHPHVSFTENNFEQCPPIPPHITEYGDDGSHVSSIDASTAVEHTLPPKLPPKLSCH